MEQITREEITGLLSTLDAALLILDESENSEHRVKARKAIAALQAAEPAMVVDIRRDPRDGSPSPRILKFADLGDGEHQLFAIPFPPAKAQVPEGYAGVTVWVGDRQVTQIVSQTELVSSNADELLRRFENARHLLTASPAPTSTTNGCTCQGCGIVYAADLIVPDEWWEKIKPEGKAEGSGLLCPTCIMDRLVEKGWSAGHIASPAPDHATDASKLVEALEKIEAYEIKSSPTATDFGVSFDRARWIGGMKEIARAALAEYRQQEEAER